MDYLMIPEEFRSVRNRWNKLAFHIHDEGWSDVELIPREGVDPQRAWEMVLNALNNPEQQQFHRCAHAAWILYSGFHDFKYRHD